MSTRGREEPITRFELAISNILRIGVTASLVVLCIGLVLMFIHHPSYLESQADLQKLTSPRAAFPHTIKAVVSGIAAGHGQAVIALGLIMLIATPIVRVGASIVGFAVERDRAFVVITSLVLLILLASFFLGRVE